MLPAVTIAPEEKWRIAEVPGTQRLVSAFHGGKTLVTSDRSNDRLCLYEAGRFVRHFALEARIKAVAQVKLSGESRVVVVGAPRRFGAQWCLAVVGPEGIDCMRPLPVEVRGDMELLVVAEGVALRCSVGVMYIHLKTGLIRWLTRVEPRSMHTDREWAFINGSSYSYGIHVPSARQMRWREPNVFCRGVFAQPGKLVTIMAPVGEDTEALVFINDTRAGVETEVDAPVGIEAMVRVGDGQALGICGEAAVRSVVGLNLKTCRFNTVAPQLGGARLYRGVGSAVIGGTAQLIYAGAGKLYQHQISGPCPENLVPDEGHFFGQTGSQVWGWRGISGRSQAGKQPISPARECIDPACLAVSDCLARGDFRSVVAALNEDLRLWTALTPDEVRVLKGTPSQLDRSLIDEISAHRRHYQWVETSCTKCMRNSVACVTRTNPFCSQDSRAWGRCFACNFLQPLTR